MMETKICEACRLVKPVTEFYFRKETGKYRLACKKCKSVNTKEKIKDRVNADTKICKHCGVEKQVSEYEKAGGGKWLQPYCKPCDKVRKDEHRAKNINTYREKALATYHRNKKLLTHEEREESKRRGVEARKITVKKMLPEERKRRKSECDKRYRENNKEKILIVKKKHYALKGNEQAKAWQKKMMGDIGFRTKKRLRGRIYVALKRGIKSESTMELLGCTIDFFKNYFESLFTEGMSWDKYMEGVSILTTLYHVKILT